MFKSMGKLFSKRKGSRHGRDKALDGAHGSHSDSMSDRAASRNAHDCGEPSPTQHPSVHSDAVVSVCAVHPGLCLSGSKDKTVVLYNYGSKKIEDKWSGHEREITKVRYGQVCSGIFSSSRDKSIKLWSRGNPHVVREYLGHDLVVSAIDISKDNNQLCSGSRDNTVRLWDVETAQCLLQSNIHRNLVSTGRSHDNTVRLWDVETAQCLLQSNIHRNLVTDVKFVPDSHLLVQTGEDKEVRLFDTRTLQVVHSFIRKQYIQMSCDVSADGVHCLTCSNGFGGNGCEATLWDLRQRSIVQEYKGHSEAVEACIFMPHVARQLIATSSRDCSVRIWDMNTKECVSCCVISGSGPLSSILCYEDGSMCVSSFNLGVLQLKFSLVNMSLHHMASF